MITAQAMKAGFGGGLVVDYPNSTKAKKYFLVLMTGAPQQLPKALGDSDAQQNQVQNEAKRYVSANSSNETASTFVRTTNELKDRGIFKNASNLIYPHL